MELRYADGPSVECAIDVDAPVERVWSLVSDIGLPARFSGELQATEWVDGPAAEGPSVGDRFVGRNHHDAIGDWETTSWVDRCDPPTSFGWAVSDPDEPSASWWFTLEPLDGRTRLTHGGRMGPARSGLSLAIDAMPDKESRIIERRLGEWRRNIEATLAGIKALAEADTETHDGQP